MATVKGCSIPDDLYYNIENNVWARRESDGKVTIRMTAYAAALAGRIVSCTPKKVGRSVEQNKSAGTVESGKWVGPVKTPVAGEVVQINSSVTSSPATINSDRYGAGWLVKLKPDRGMCVDPRQVIAHERARRPGRLSGIPIITI